jgi:hypothetical protein
MKVQDQPKDLHQNQEVWVALLLEVAMLLEVAVALLEEKKLAAKQVAFMEKELVVPPWIQ